MLETDIFQTPLDQKAPSVQEKEKTDRYDRIYAEETIKIRTRDFGKGILIPQVKSDSTAPIDGQNRLLVGKKGTFTACTLGYDLNVRYSVNLNAKYVELNLNYGYGNISSSWRNQTVRLNLHELWFGTGWSFVCNLCGKPSKTLYLPSGESFFACRACKNVVYGLCYLDRKVPHHQYFYNLNRINKIMSDSPDYKRIFYGGTMTKKAKRTIDMYQKSGVRPQAGVQMLIDMNNAMVEAKRQKAPQA